jgi:hypothetical protein
MHSHNFCNEKTYSHTAENICRRLRDQSYRTSRRADELESTMCWQRSLQALPRSFRRVTALQQISCHSLKSRGPPQNPQKRAAKVAIATLVSVKLISASSALLCLPSRLLDVQPIIGGTPPFHTRTPHDRQRIR